MKDVTNTYPTGKAAVRASSYVDLGESKQDLPKGNQTPSDLQLRGLLVSAGFLIHHCPALMMTYSIFCPLTLGEKRYFLNADLSNLMS